MVSVKEQFSEKLKYNLKSLCRQPEVGSKTALKWIMFKKVG